ncbi:ferric reductase NAD binding domain containing protein [Nitzschia inconspicua]|uniref:Ferric reductase NAD binding domain containing protein n=1 Tax=Nitzschia inconspicua TaxID=303405 RepID=A0A9K3PT36_9STRA|nr:ferric reductase NAD binding domain containing protein [Nitzschia inconspicua]
MEIASLVAKTTAIFCLLWVMFFLLLGGGSSGKSLFSSWASASILQDGKSGVPILMLTLPILIAGTAASLFANTSTIGVPNSGAMMTRRTFLCRLKSFWFIQKVSWIWSSCSSFFITILLPSLVYVLSSLHRHLSKSGLTTDKKLLEIGNTFGMLAVVALSWLLVPVSKARGPLDKLFDWDPILVLQVFHIWSGRIVVMGGLLHGFFHFLRLGMQSRQILGSYLVPPLGCWKNPQTYEPPVCELTDKNGCSCYDHFRVFTGLVAAIGLGIIGITSLYKIRRRFFSTFALTHYILTPLTFAMICIHYNKTILYASGSLLYYMASSFPVWMEYWGNRLRHKPAKIVAIERIDADSSQLHRPCVAVTLEASKMAIQHYRPGFFCRLLIPSVSEVSHPFTINTVPKQPHRIRIIFRVTGSFTRSLEKALHCDGNDFVSRQHSGALTNTSSEIFLQGYCGSGNLFDRVSSHDVCVLIAAGVGITPYLSLFASMANATDDGQIRDRVMTANPRKIVVHWVCRDEALIQYCQREYLDPLLQETVGMDGFLLQVNIYHTGRGQEGFVDVQDGSRSTTGTDLSPEMRDLDVISAPGVPFEPSIHTVGGRMKQNVSYAFVFSVISWGGLWILWRSYLQQEAEAYTRRLSTLLVVTLYVLVISLAANICWCLDSRRRRGGWSQVADECDLDEDIATFELPAVDRKMKSEKLQSDAEGFAVQQEERGETVKINLYKERPSIKQMLDGIEDDSSTALFCCVPPSFASQLNDAANRSRCSAVGSRITIYRESFEI